MLGSTQQVARILFEKLGLTPGRKGKTGYSTDTRVLRSIRGEHEIVGGDRGVARAVEAAQHLPRAAADADRRRTAGCTRRSTRPSPRPAGSRPRTRTSRRSRSAPSSAARSAPRSSPRRGHRLRLGRLLADRAAHPRARLGRAEAARGVRARRGHPHARPRPRCSASSPAKLTKGERSIAKMINFGIVYGISAFGLSENLEIPREQAQEYIDAYLARFPHVQDFIARTIEQAARDGYVTSLLGRRRPVPEIRASNRQTRSLGERLAVNFVMQGSNADIIKVAMIRIAPAAARRGPQRAARAPGARRAAARGAGAEVSAVQGARPRGDVRRLRARSAARGRRRRRRQLGRGEDVAGLVPACLAGLERAPAILTGFSASNETIDARQEPGVWVDRPRRRADSRLRLDLPRDQRGPGRARHGRPRRQGRGARRHRLQVGGRHPGLRALDPPLGQPGRRGRRSATRSTRSCSRRRTPRAA